MSIIYFSKILYHLPMVYVDGYVLAVPKANLQKYKKLAKKAGEMWMKHGALGYTECKGEDLGSSEWCKLPFPKVVKCKEDETVVFAFIQYKSRAHRDRVNAKVMKEMCEENPDHTPEDMPFDMKRMAFGGFESMVNLS